MNAAAKFSWTFSQEALQSWSNPPTTQTLDASFQVLSLTIDDDLNGGGDQFPEVKFYSDLLNVEKSWGFQEIHLAIQAID